MPYKDPAKAREAVRKSQAKRQAARTPEEKAAKCEALKAWRAANRGKVLAAKRVYREKHPDKARAQVRASHAKYDYKPERLPCRYCRGFKPEGQGLDLCEPCRVHARAAKLEYTRQWFRDNPGKANAKNMKRYAAKLRAMPLWLTREQHQEIVLTYSAASSAGMHVDHIVPLQGKNVSGLHVPWNLQLLTPSENMSKGNRCHF